MGSDVKDQKVFITEGGEKISSEMIYYRTWEQKYSRSNHHPMGQTSIKKKLHLTDNQNRA